ncbi:glycosyltransferase [Leucobacter tenebrionis]|uniref:glycosyltransferase n=1 Tax=Leucobacter tenebrionis TaxID=2873270 RepID=UPI001CA67A3F|nr:glycosyltransferase [Leucobacter tenebrionis]QZY51419.1 glycosyltransferase [Leucobacter tenebrionis]
MPSEFAPNRARVGYVVKVYPRFSETFIVSELIAREAAGETFEVFALRPSDDPRFHPELARVAAPVTYLPRPTRPSAFWETIRTAAADPHLAAAIGKALPELLDADADEAVQAIALAAHARRAGLEHLHAHFASGATTVARLASLLTGIPYSFTAHAKDIFHDDVDLELLRRKIAGARYVATVSRFNARFLGRLAPEYAERIHLVPNAVELDRFRYRAPMPHEGPLRIAAVGRLVEKKGFDVLIEAVAELHARGVPMLVTLAGGGELADPLSERIRYLGLEAIVRMTGPLPQDGVAALLREADVFVAPCVVGSDGNADGLPTVLLEAMASGVPCVSTRVTGIPEVVIDGETGLLCEPGDRDGLVAALERIATGRTDVTALARGARELVELHHDVRLTAARHADLTAGTVTRAAVS